MKKTLRPHSQLFLFSDTLDPRIETWFAGNIIIEQELSGNSDICEEIRKLSNMISLLQLGNFKYVTTVINFKTANLLLLKLSGLYPVMSAFTTKQNYTALNRIFKTYTCWVNRLRFFVDFEDHEHQLLSHLKSKDPIRKKLYKKEIEIMHSFKQNNDEIRNLIAQEIRNKLLL